MAYTNNTSPQVSPSNMNKNQLPEPKPLTNPILKNKMAARMPVK